MKMIDFLISAVRKSSHRRRIDALRASTNSPDDDYTKLRHSSAVDRSKPD